MTGSAGPQLVSLAIANIALFAVAAGAIGVTFVGPHGLQSAAGQLSETGVLAAVLTLPQVSADGSPVSFSAVFAMVAIVVGGLAGALDGLLISRLDPAAILCILGEIGVGKSTLMNVPAAGTGGVRNR